MELTNRYTGQVYDLSDGGALREAYCDLKAMKAFVKLMDESVKKGMIDMLGGEEEKMIGAYHLKATKRITRSYPVSVLKQCFDEDQFIECVKPINKRVEEMIKILPEGPRIEVESSMVVSGETTTYKII